MARFLNSQGVFRAGDGPLRIFAQRRLDPAARSIERMFPGYLSGDRIVCSVPAIPEWPVAVAGILGDMIDCAAPTPGATPDSGMYHILDCAEAIP